MAPTTRSRTGKLPPPSMMVDDFVDDRDDDGDHAVVDHEESDEPDERPAKRPRKASNTKAKKGNGLSKRKQGRLSALPTMPLDILYEIFSHLLPVDLVQLSRVSKAFRRVLLSRRCAFLWKGAYELTPDVPPCPADMSHPAWSNLLFGGAFCHTCGAKPVAKVIFILQRRACNACLANHLLGDVIQIQALYPKFDLSLLEFLPATTEGPKSRGRVWYGNHWWDEDICRLQKEFDAVGEEVGNMDSDEYREAIQAFKAKKKQALEARKEHTRLCREWNLKKVDDRWIELQQIKDTRYEEIQSRCLQLGYTKADVAEMRYHREVKSAKPMSDRVWARIWPILKPDLDAAQARRLAAEKRARRKCRETLAADQYINFLKTLPPKDVPFLPSEHDVLELHSIADLIEEDAEVNQQMRQALADVMPHIQGELDHWMQNRRAALSAKLPEPKLPSTNTESSSLSGPSAGVSSPASPSERLDLATSVFICKNSLGCRRYAGTGGWGGQVLVGAEVIAHRCQHLDHSRNVDAALPEYHEKGSEVVSTVIQLLGLDARTTKPDDLDRLDPRFICLNCSAHTTQHDILYGGPGVVRRRALSWRACVEHTLYGLATNHDVARFELLGEQETIIVKDQENPIIHGADQHWGCAHCAIHIERHNSLSTWLYREVVVQHVKESHGIDNPVETQDFFWNPRFHKKFPSPTAYDYLDDDSAEEDYDGGYDIWGHDDFDSDEDEEYMELNYHAHSWLGILAGF